MDITDFDSDSRGVTTQVGTVLVFGFLIVSLSLYQANVVPAQNSQVEFNHYQQVQGDMHDLRNTILEVAATNKQQSAALKLGTRYPTRVFTMNAPPPYGSVKATQLGTGRIALSGVNLSAICGRNHTTTTAIKYTPDYNYLDTAAPITYENSVLYRQTSDGTVLLSSDQTLISGQTINLQPLRTNVSYTRTGTVSLDFQAKQTGETQASTPLTLTIPTHLSNTTWEAQLLAHEPAVKRVVENTSRPSAVDIELQRNLYTIQCTPTATHPQPNVTITDQGDETVVNPGDVGSIRLEAESRPQKNVVNLSFNNTAGIDRSIQQARINFYQDTNEQGNPPAYATLTNRTDDVAATLTFRGDLQETQPRIGLAGNGTRTAVKLKFYTDSGKEANLDSGDWLVLTLHFSEGESATYFIPVPE